MTKNQTDCVICQLTDLHFGAAPFDEKDQKTLKELTRFFEAHHDYDLVMITGDLMWGKQTTNLTETLGPLYELLNQYDFPVGVTYGNHDSESQFSMDEVRQSEQLLKYPAVKRDAKVMRDRQCYWLQLKNHAIYVWDSGAYSHWGSDDAEDIYAVVEPEEIQWFLEASADRSKEETDIGFLHIPLPEYQQAINNTFNGIKGEPICSPKANSGLFYALRRQGNVKAVFAGHDHYNNFDSQLHGVGLNYGNVTGYNCESNLPRGVKEIFVGDQVTTKIRLFTD